MEKKKKAIENTSTLDHSLERDREGMSLETREMSPSFVTLTFLR